ncbi:MAG TPA: YihY/virulence factor BrkB family protein [Acidobacteriaceae bacterium]|nr:YihY/virulence factor BrkB family protein [Acidobacteriaceae bacterium]
MTLSVSIPRIDAKLESDEALVGAPPLPKPPARSANATLRKEIWSLARYMAQTEVHTYAFSVAANTILSLFPFIVMMFTLARDVFHSHAMESAIADMIRYFLPTGQQFVTKNMEIVAHARKGVQFASVIMLLISSTGVFLPLEVALNKVWGVTRNRSYVMNQLVALGLAAAIGTLALFSVALDAAQQTILQVLFFGHIGNSIFSFLSHWMLRISAASASILLFFLIYWVLPNRKLPVRAVLPTAVVVGLLWELAKMLYIAALPWMDLHSVYGPFSVSVSLMLWAFVTGLLLLAGAHYSATRHALRLAYLADLERAREEMQDS